MCLIALPPGVLRCLFTLTAMVVFSASATHAQESARLPPAPGAAADAPGQAEIIARVEVPIGRIKHLVAIGDHDEDDVSDLAVILQGPYFGSVLPKQGGIARIVSGRDGSLLEELIPDRAETISSFGHGVCVLPRTDRPASLAFGSPLADGTGAVSIRDVDGSIVDVPGDGHRFFGWHMDTVGDADGDGQDDLAIGARDSLAIVSSATGKTLRQWTGKRIEEIACRVGASDGSGLQAVATLEYVSHDDRLAAVIDIRSLEDGSSRAMFELGAQRLSVADMVSLGDHDGDGVRDLLLAYKFIDGPGPHLAVLSGTDGAQLFSFRFRDFLSLAPGRLIETLDVDGDGFHDVLYPVSHVTPVIRRSSTQVAVISGRSLQLIRMIDVRAPGLVFENKLAAIYERGENGKKLIGCALAYKDTEGDPQSGGVALVSFDL